MASVELRSLTKRYGTVAVVDDISLTIEHGHLVCLLGPSGCGKTTTLRLIAGFVEPSAGEIRVGDKLVSSPAHTLPPERRNMSMIFQSYALWPHMTVAENIVYGLKLRKIGSRIQSPRNSTPFSRPRSLRRWRNAIRANCPAASSSAWRWRVRLIVEPETLLLDEPLSNLDANLREEMRFEVRRLHDAYRYTTVYVTHDQSEAMTTADLICVMNGGKIEQSGIAGGYLRPSALGIRRALYRIEQCHQRQRSRRFPRRFCRHRVALRRRENQFRRANAGFHSPARHRYFCSATAQAENIVPATVVRQVFLGGTRDYMVEAKDGTQLRVLTAAGENIPQGSAVWLHLPPERCRALSWTKQ